MNRGARRLPIFGDDHDRTSFLSLLETAVSRHDVEFHAYALMDNHFHLLARADVRELAAAMQFVSSGHAQRHNARYGFDGPLFRSRYRSRPIDEERYLRRALRYIHRNPVAHSTGRVGLASFRWTSHLAYLGLVPTPSWLRVTPLLDASFGRDLDAYRDFVHEGDKAPLDYEPPVEPSTGEPRAFTPSQIERALGVRSEPEREVLRSGGRGVRNDERLACVLLCFELTDCAVPELGARYGFGSPSTVRSAISRARKLWSSDERFARLVDDARGRLHMRRDAA